MYIYANDIDMLQSGCHYIILQALVENDTLIQIRYCHLLGIWYVFIVDMLFSFSFFYSAHDKIYVDICLKIFGCILVLYTHHV